MRLKKIHWYKKIFPIFHITNDKYFDKNIYECVKVFGPIVMTRENNTCGEKKLLGIRYAEQFYRGWMVSNLIGRFSMKMRLRTELRVHAEHLRLYQGAYLRKRVLEHARLIWAERGFRETHTVDYIAGRLLVKRLLLTRSEK
jgi:hypothetical protein